MLGKCFLLVGYKPMNILLLNGISALYTVIIESILTLKLCQWPYCGARRHFVGYEEFYDPLTYAFSLCRCQTHSFHSFSSTHIHVRSIWGLRSIM